MKKLNLSKLSLRTQTIANLSADDLRRVGGAAWTTILSVATTDQVWTTILSVNLTLTGGVTGGK